jgi:hypothetical protein
MYELLTLQRHIPDNMRNWLQNVPTKSNYLIEFNFTAADGMVGSVIDIFDEPITGIPSVTKSQAEKFALRQRDIFG